MEIIKSEKEKVGQEFREEQSNDPLIKRKDDDAFFQHPSHQPQKSAAVPAQRRPLWERETIGSAGEARGWCWKGRSGELLCAPASWSDVSGCEIFTVDVKRMMTEGRLHSAS